MFDSDQSDHEYFASSLPTVLTAFIFAGKAWGSNEMLLGSMASFRSCMLPPETGAGILDKPTEL